MKEDVQTQDDRQHRVLFFLFFFFFSSMKWIVIIRKQTCSEPQSSLQLMAFVNISIFVSQIEC